MVYLKAFQWESEEWHKNFWVMISSFSFDILQLDLTKIKHRSDVRRRTS